jgi:hypothetical protein
MVSAKTYKKCSVRFIPFLILIFVFMGDVCDSKSSQLKSCEPVMKIQKTEPHQQIEITERYAKSVRGRISGIPVLILRGNYEEIGEAHGALAGKDIIHLLDSILIPFINRTQTNAWDINIIPASNSCFFPEDYERELNSILTGIKKKHVHKNDRMLYSIKREITVQDLRALNCFIDIMYSAGGCSSFSAWGSMTDNGEVIIGRNLDDRYIPGKPPFMILARELSMLGRQSTIDITGPGVIGSSTAMNADGLIVMGHDANGLPPSNTNRWTPRAIVMREVIESIRASDSVEQISRIFQNKPVTIGNNTHIAQDINKRPKSPLPFVVEWDGNQKDNGVTLRTVEHSELHDAIVCTNHFLKRRPKTGESTHSKMRYRRLTELLNEVHASRKVVDLGKAIKMMDSVAENGATVTYLSVIGFPKTRKIIFAVSPGDGISATKGKWIEISWDQLFQPL